MQVALMLGDTVQKVIPVTLMLAVVFTVLEHFWACNAGPSWWRKREIVTDICYWFFVTGVRPHHADRTPDRHRGRRLQHPRRRRADRLL
ncbi:hypothetical protein ACVWYH_002528 [Bradyrhizobium sp. GM24.11]